MRARAGPGVPRRPGEPVPPCRKGARCASTHPRTSADEVSWPASSTSWRCGMSSQVRPSSSRPPALRRAAALAACAHEHACVRCPMLSINPEMPPRLDELEADLLVHRQRAIDEGWRGEVEGLDLTLRSWPASASGPTGPPRQPAWIVGYAPRVRGPSRNGLRTGTSGFRAVEVSRFVQRGRGGWWSGAGGWPRGGGGARRGRRGQGPRGAG